MLEEMSWLRRYLFGMRGMREWEIYAFEIRAGAGSFPKQPFQHRLNYEK